MLLMLSYVDRMELSPGMIFTIEPMLTLGRQDCFEWDDEWTVVRTKEVDPWLMCRLDCLDSPFQWNAPAPGDS